VTDPDELRRAATDAACVIFQQPNFFGCLEPAPELAAAANDAEAIAVAHVDPISLGVLEAPGSYGCGIANRRRTERRQLPVPSRDRITVCLAARKEFIRRMPGRIVGETLDAGGERGYVLTLQTGSSTSGARRRRRTSRRTRRCWRSRALCTFRGWGRRGYVRWGRPA